MQLFNKYIILPFLDSVYNYKALNAFCIDGEYFTYKQFLQRIAAIMKSLINIKESNIGLIANDDLDTYASIFAIWFTRKTYVPLNPETPIERNQSVIDQVGIKTILDSKETKCFISQDFEASIVLLKSHLHNFAFDYELAYIFFTSGSTGTPKGVTITKKNVASFVEAFWAMGYEISEKDRCLQMFDLTFDLSVMSYLLPLLKGACVYTIPKGQVKYSYIYELLDEKELTIALMVPSILNYLHPYFSEIDCPKMRYSLFCGEALYNEIIKEWSKCVPNARIDNVYGPTENTIFCTYYTYQREIENDIHNGILSIGKPMLNNFSVVFDDDNKLANFNEPGELCLAGPQLTPGYFNNPLLNQALFFTTAINGINTRFYRTGDICVLKENGNINFIGRKDFQVKIQGFRVELSEIEYYAIKAVKDHIVLIALALQNAVGNFEIAIVFESPEFDVADVIENMKSKMPSYMIPTQYFFVKQFPLNKNGKIDRTKLKNIIQT